MARASVVDQQKYGRISVRENPEVARNLRVSVNGEEVSSKCFEADDMQGYALCYVLAANGLVALTDDKSEILTERIDGEVRIWNK